MRGRRPDDVTSSTEDRRLPARLTRAERRHPVLAGVTAAYLLLMAGYGLVVGATLTVPYVVIVASGALAIAVADDQARFSTPVLIGLSAWGFGHLAGGLVELDGGRILYNVVLARWVHLDNVVHFVGFGSAGAACWEATRPWLPDNPGHRLGTIVVVCLFGMGVGALNEVVEFAASHLLSATNVGGYENTGRDLVANLFGSLTAGVLLSRRTKPRP